MQINVYFTYFSLLMPAFWVGWTERLQPRTFAQDFAFIIQF